MVDIWMDVDVNLAEVPVNIMPLLDDTDFKAIEAAIAYNVAGLALYWHFVTAAGAYSVTAVTPTTGGNYDWTDQGDAGIYTIEIPASGGASINNDTEGFGWFTGKATGVLPWRGPVIGFRRAALNDLFIDGGTASSNLEDFFDGTGYAGGTTKLGIDVVNWKGSTAPAMTGDAYARLGAPAGASIAADLVTIDNFVDGVESTLSTISGYLDTEIAAILAAVDTEVAAIKAKTDSLTFTVANKIDANVYTWNGTAVHAPGTAGVPIVDIHDASSVTIGTVTNLTNAATNGDLTATMKSSVTTAASSATPALSAAGVDAIWDELASGHAVAGSFGKYLDSDISANTDHITADYGSTEKSAIDLLDDAYSGTLHAAIADAVWEEAKSGHTTASTFGDLGAEAFTLADDAITSAKFDESTAFPIKSADTGATIIARPGDKMDIVDAPSSTGVLAIVDAFLTRAFGSVTYTGTTRCVLTALQKLRNKVANSGGTQTVYKENDSTASYTSTITTDAAADPVVSIDPDS